MAPQLALLGRVRSKLLVVSGVVTAVDWLTPSLVAVRALVETPQLSGVRPEVGMHFALGVSGSGSLTGSTWRRYTISRVCRPATETTAASATEFEWLAFSAGDRTGACWHHSLRIGSEIAVRAFDAGMHRRTRPNDREPTVWLVDETGIGSVVADTEHRPGAVQLVVAMTGDPRNAAALELRASVPTQHAASEQAAVNHLLEFLLRASGATEPTWARVAGGQSLVAAVKAAERALGDRRHRFTSRTYWAPGKSGLE
jgi:hypothetical protein